MDITRPVTDIRGVGPELAKKFAALGIQTVSDISTYYPRRYDDYSHVSNIRNIRPGIVTLKATLSQATGRYVRRGLHITEAIASDTTGSVRLLWFNQPYRAASFKPKQEYFISGEFALSRQRMTIQNPSVELVSSFPVNTARIVPVYREAKGLKAAQFRKVVQEVLPLIRTIPETLPEWLVHTHQLMSRARAVETLHFPDSHANLAQAKRRLGFEEVFELSLASLLNKYEQQQERALVIPFDETLAKEFVMHLPFTLTDTQRKVIWQIYLDLQRPQPMNRLVEGDVGSGKTVVAAMAAVMVMKQGFQVAFMAPTELLARQHAETIYNLMQPLGMADSVSLLVGSLKSAQKERARTGIADGSVRFIVGTHALIAEKVDMHKLGLIIVDEQHRFGVEQRKMLQAKAGFMPHVLSLSATPIPRSLALTLYGELDISIIDTKPAGRKPILTKICSPNSRKQLYEKIDLQLAAGRQMFVVCPLITDSDALGAEHSAEAMYKKLSQGAFKHRRVALLHGKLKPTEKTAVMEAFMAGTVDILVATTVIEVGVDVPNATVMMIEAAERFGLAQMHQLRGRVGRSSHQGYCFLMMGDSSAPSRRLRALEQSSDGFALAELDLEIRGPGAMYGAQQHGALDLRIAQLSDTKLIAAARSAAQKFIDMSENLVEYTQLHEHVMRLRAVTNLN